jgi:carbamoylphosphate synthase large subunit
MNELETPSRLDAIQTIVNDRAGIAADAATRHVVLIAATCAWPATAKLAVALKAASCAVVSIAPARHPLNETTAVGRRFRYSAVRPLQALVEAIGETRPDLIIACDERVVAHLHRLHAKSADPDLRNLIERSLGRPEFYPLTTARAAVAALATAHGVRTPQSRPIRSPADLSALAETLPFPWVVKTDGSWGGWGVRIVRDLAAAQQAFRSLSAPVRLLVALRKLLFRRDSFWLSQWLNQPRGEISAQRFIEGRPANCAVAAADGETLSGIAVEVLAADGETGPAAIVRLTDDPTMLAAGARIVEALRMSGFVGFDFVIETRTGLAYLLEMNPRPTPICHLRLGAGRDPIGALIARLDGLPAPVQPAETACDTIALFPQANQYFGDQPLLARAYQDMPHHEPALIRTLLSGRSRVPYQPLLIPDAR